MGSTIRARFSQGTLKPLEAVELREGDEVTITIVSSRPESAGDWLDRTAGGWAGVVDADELKREIYDSRLIAARTEPRLLSRFLSSLIRIWESMLFTEVFISIGA